VELEGKEGMKAVKETISWRGRIMVILESAQLGGTERKEKCQAQARCDDKLVGNKTRDRTLNGGGVLQ